MVYLRLCWISRQGKQENGLRQLDHSFEHGISLYKRAMFLMFHKLSTEGQKFFV